MCVEGNPSRCAGKRTRGAHLQPCCAAHVSKLAAELPCVSRTIIALPRESPRRSDRGTRAPATRLLLAFRDRLYTPSFAMLVRPGRHRQRPGW